MTTMTQPDTTTQTYRVYIKATPEAIWNAITKPEWAERYGYGGRIEYELSPGGAFRAFASEEMVACGAPEVVIEGEVVEADPPRKLVQTWHPIWSPESAAEAATHLTYEIEEGEGGITTLTLIHDLEGAPGTGAMVGGAVEGAGGGWSYVLSDMKTLLETGRSLED